MRKIRVDKATRKYQAELQTQARRIARHERIEDMFVRSRERILAGRRTLDRLRNRIDKGSAPVEQSPVEAAIAKLTTRRAKR